MNEIEKAPEGWRHKDVFHRDGKGFLIEVSRHTSPVIREFDSEGPHRWCVYAHIYPKHLHFAAFSGPHIWQDATQVLPLRVVCIP